MSKFFVSFFAVLLIASSCLAQNRPIPELKRNEHQHQVPHDIDESGSGNDYWVYTTDEVTEGGPDAGGDTLWKKRVWREIDVREATNKCMGYDSSTPANCNLMSIMIEGFKAGKYKAYDPVDDKFTKELSQEDMAMILARSSMGAITDFNPRKITGYRIKEDWIFLKSAGQMVVRIAGIAPVIKTTGADGSIIDQPLFWLKYTDIHFDLLAHEVCTHSADNDQNKMNWYTFFETRMFSSKITKVGNPFNQNK